MSSDQNKISPLSDLKDPTSKERKLDHIEMAFRSQVDLHNIDNRFYYEPLLTGHPNNDNTTSFEFLNSSFKSPLWVSSMTGGTQLAKRINENLAKACQEFGFGMGLGSCRSLLYSDEFLSDFAIRKHIGNQALYANLGIAQIEELIEQNQLSLIPLLISKLEADGLIIHVNPLQEWLQPEGDRIKNPPIESIIKVLDQLDISIIVKEVGQGMGYESLKALFQLPLEAIDFAANGGTNFAKLEMHRASPEMQSHFMKIANLGHSAEEMVNFTNQIIAELGDKCLCHQVIVSGGVRDFLDGYYYIEKLNVSAIYGQASAFLKHARGEYEELQKYIGHQISGLQLAQSYLKIKES